MILASLTVLPPKNGSTFWNNWLVFLHVISYLKIAFLHGFQFIFLDWTIFFSLATVVFTSLMYFQVQGKDAHCTK